MKILITGINGLLGKDIGYCLGLNPMYELFGIGRANMCYAPNVKYSRMDISDFIHVDEYLKSIKPDVIIHCAAMTKIDQCEIEREYALRVNVEASRRLAQYGCRMIYMSSDAVFSGNKGEYSEDDRSDAINFYGKSKFEGEQVVLEENNNAVSLRMSVYGYNINLNKSVVQWAAENIKKQSDINGFTDVIINPLYTKQIVQVIQMLLKKDYSGVLNIGSKEFVSKYELFCKIAKRMNMSDEKITAVSVNSMSFSARRTKNTTLNVDKMKSELNIEFSIEDGLDEFYNDYLRWL